MSSAALASLRSELNELEGIYGLRFANQSRLTRDLRVLDDVLERAEKVREQLAEIGDAEARDLHRRSGEMLSQYREERDQIARVQKNRGPEVIEARLLGQRANAIIYRYRRHYAGHARNTRDRALLKEMLEDIRAVQQEMVNLSNAYGNLSGLEDDLDVVRNQVELYRNEIAAIADAQASGTAEERAGLLGTLANAQFENYRVHFAGHPRLSRRPQLMERIIASLESLLEDMQGLSQRGFSQDFHKRNQQIVGDRLEAYRNELTAIREARENASIDDVNNSLGLAANTILSEYGENFAGQSRTTRDLELLSGLCDRMGEVERQMVALARVTDMPNLGIARDALSMFEREYREIEKVQNT